MHQRACLLCFSRSLRTASRLTLILLRLQTQYYTNSALCDYVATLPAPGSDTPAESQEDFTLPGFLSSLVALAKARFGNNRVFIPLLFTLAELAEAGSFDAATTYDGPDDCTQTQSLRDLLKISCSALEKTKSRARLSATCRVYVTFSRHRCEFLLELNEFFPQACCVRRPTLGGCRRCNPSADVPAAFATLGTHQADL